MESDGSLRQKALSVYFRSVRPFNLNLIQAKADEIRSNYLNMNSDGFSRQKALSVFVPSARPFNLNLIQVIIDGIRINNLNKLQKLIKNTSLLNSHNFHSVDFIGFTTIYETFPSFTHDRLYTLIEYDPFFLLKNQKE